MAEPAPLIQVVLGGRQVGKTTGVRQLLAGYAGPTHYTSADEALTSSGSWLVEQWQRARELGSGTLLVIDEVQKVPDWSGRIKALWDNEDPTTRPRCILLGSSSLSIQKGLSESLTGRFELIRVFHWSFAECHAAFGHDLDCYMTYGGYPGAEPFRDDYERWFRYLKSSVVDTVIGQDILSHHTVTKPALFRQAFEVLCGYPAREVSYTTLLGQLQDRGNTDLVKHYLELYSGAYLFAALEKFSGKTVRTKSSSPKILPMCPALFTLAKGPDAIQDSEQRGFAFEAIVGMDLLRAFQEDVYYWRDGKHEVDYVLARGSNLWAIEVKSGRRRSGAGLEVFSKKFKTAAGVVIHPDNYASFAKDPKGWLERHATPGVG